MLDCSTWSDRSGYSWDMRRNLESQTPAWILFFATFLHIAILFYLNWACFYVYRILAKEYHRGGDKHLEMCGRSNKEQRNNLDAMWPVEAAMWPVEAAKLWKYQLLVLSPPILSIFACLLPIFTIFGSILGPNLGLEWWGSFVRAGMFFWPKHGINIHCIRTYYGNCFQNLASRPFLQILALRGLSRRQQNVYHIWLFTKTLKFWVVSGMTYCHLPSLALRHAQLILL